MLGTYQVGLAKVAIKLSSRSFTEKDYTKHMLGDATGRTERAVPERTLTASEISILRAILHLTMLGATISDPQVIQINIHP